MATQGHSREVVVLSGKRTGFGTFGGSLKDFTATDLGVFSSQAAIEAAGLTPSQVDQTFVGNALQTSADSIYLARHVALRSGVPQDRPALTVNRLCGSGFEAVVQGAKEIVLGEESQFEITIKEENGKSFVRAISKDGNISDSEQLLSKINESLS